MSLYTELKPLLSTQLNMEIPTRMSSILDTKKYFETEQSNSRHTYKRYKRVHLPFQYFCVIESYLSIAMFLALSQIPQKDTKETIDWVMFGVCIFSAACGTIAKIIESKRNKHAEINVLASSKLNSVIDKIIKAQEDQIISQDEYDDILKERAEYERD